MSLGYQTKNIPLAASLKDVDGKSLKRKFKNGYEVKIMNAKNKKVKLGKKSNQF